MFKRNRRVTPTEPPPPPAPPPAVPDEPLPEATGGATEVAVPAETHVEPPHDRQKRHGIGGLLKWLLIVYGVLIVASIVVYLIAVVAEANGSHVIIGFINGVGRFLISHFIFGGYVDEAAAGAAFLLYIFIAAFVGSVSGAIMAQIRFNMSSDEEEEENDED